jgi:hypothetical protein
VPIDIDTLCEAPAPHGTRLCDDDAALEELVASIRTFVLDVIEKVQRRELSGRERVGVIALLAGLADACGRPLGVRAISRQTGLAPSTISRWLHIDRSPLLKAALEEEQLDIGRAMKLVAAPNDQLPELIARAGALSQADVAATVAALRANPGVAVRDALANQRRAAAAYRALLQIDAVGPPVRATLERIHRYLDQLLGH